VTAQRENEGDCRKPENHKPDDRHKRAVIDQSSLSDRSGIAKVLQPPK
jgi:hypothetical protein